MLYNTHSEHTQLKSMLADNNRDKALTFQYVYS